MVFLFAGLSVLLYILGVAIMDRVVPMIEQLEQVNIDKASTYKMKLLWPVLAVYTMLGVSMAVDEADDE